MEENVIQIKSGIMINVDVSVKNIIYVKKNCFWRPATCSCENSKYLASIIDDSVIMRDEIIDADTETKSYDEETKTIPKNIVCETKSCYILLAVLLITVALLIVVSIYCCYVIKYKTKK